MLQVKTDLFKDMVFKSVKGVGNNKLIPITSLLGIKVKNGTLTLQTTDATNYLYIINKVDGDTEDFNVTVPVELFSKLISKMTCEHISLILEGNVLRVKGSGDYKIELPVDESGDLIDFPNPVKTFDNNDAVEDTVQRATIQSILTSLKPSLAVTLEDPCYTGYYVGSHVIATNTYSISDLDVQLFEKPMLLNSQMVDLLGIMTDEEINVQYKDNDILFSSRDCVVYGTLLEGIEEFNVDAISNLVSLEFDSMCKLSKSHLLAILDRINLFVTQYDDNGIDIVFTDKGCNISSKSTTGVDSIEYIDVQNFKEFKCTVDIELLSSQIKSITSDVIELYYGLDNALKIVDGDITQIVALLDNE